MDHPVYIYIDIDFVWDNHDISWYIQLVAMGFSQPFSHPWIIPHRIHGAAISGNMDPINIPQMLAYIYVCVYMHIYQHHGSVWWSKFRDFSHFPSPSRPGVAQNHLKMSALSHRAWQIHGACGAHNFGPPKSNRNTSLSISKARSTTI